MALLSFYGPMFALWGVAGHAAFRRTGRVSRAVAAGGIAALTTFIVFTAIVITRMNLSLDTIVDRPDWRNMVATYERSGFESFRAYANYVYLTGAPFKIFVASTIGALTGLIGGVVGQARRSSTRARLPSH